VKREVTSTCRGICSWESASRTLAGSGEIPLLQGAEDSFMDIRCPSIVCASVAHGSSRRFYCY